MSATVGNVRELAGWMGAELFVTDFRPIKLTEKIVGGLEMLSSDGKPSVTPFVLNGKQKVEGHLCFEAVRNGQQVLFFCPTKLMCQDMCKHLCSNAYEGALRGPVRDNLQVQRRLLLEKLKSVTDGIAGGVTSVDKLLIDAVPYGIAFHHAGLEPANRALIEKAFKDGVVVILVATSTLAAGVNLPAGRVIIKSLKIGRDMLKTANYKQMVGRAGRPGQSTTGESFLVVEKCEIAAALKIVNGALPNVTSQLAPRRNGIKLLLKALLDIHALSFCRTLEDVIHFAKLTLMFRECMDMSSSTSHSSESDVINTILNATMFLVRAHAVSMTALPVNDGSAEKSPCQSPETAVVPIVPIHITKFGLAVVHCGLNPDEAIVIYEALLSAHDGLDLSNNVHLIYLVTPTDHALHPDFSRLLQWYDYSIKHHETVSRTNTNTDQRIKGFVGNLLKLEDYYSYLVTWSQQPPGTDEVTKCYSMLCTESVASANDPTATANSEPVTSHLGVKTKNVAYWKALCICKRLWGSIFIDELIKGKPMPVLCKEFAVDLSDALGLQYSIRIMSGRVERLCAELGWKALEGMCKHIRHMLSTGTSSKCKDLLELPPVTPKLADILVEFGTGSIESLAAASACELAEYVRLKTAFEAQVEIPYIAPVSDVSFARI
jgi:DNA polymerase theta